MPNKYKYNTTFEELREEEDREIINDLMREQISYYETLNKINKKFLSVLNNMGNDEIKEVIINGGFNPVKKL